MKKTGFKKIQLAIVKARLVWLEVAVLVIVLAGLGGIYYITREGGQSEPYPTSDSGLVVLPGPTAEAAPKVLTLTVDTAAAGRPISPYIYGVAEASTGYLAQIGAKLNRWGGNSSSRYNWELGNAWNAARDYFFQNADQAQVSSSDSQPSGAADKFVLASQEAGATAFISVPAMGYVANNNDGSIKSSRVPEHGKPGLNESGAISGYDPAQNRQHTSLTILPAKPGPLAYPPDLNDATVYADEWINHLVTRFGPAANGGVKFYAVDNEPDLWAETHTDVHPALPGYEELLQKYLDFSAAIRRQDRTAKIVGPALSSPARMYYSPLDEATGKADRKAHGDKPFLEWWLSAVRASDEKRGLRTLDVLDVHYYPGQNVFFGDKANDPTKGPLRIDATRALWDGNYRDAATGENTALIPRLKDIVNRNYPGTLVGIGEWNFGGERQISGAIAVADSLGIFGERDLYYASYWTTPPENSPAFFGFKLFGNYDSQGGRFGDMALPTASSDRRKVAIYAARRSSNGQLTFIVINKTEQSQKPLFDLKNLPEGNNRSIKIWQYSQADLSNIKALPALSPSSSSFSYELPAYSITLLETGR